MLKQRVITALVLLLILLPALFYHSPAPFCAIALLLIAAAAWEWARLNGYGRAASLFSGLVCVVVCAATWTLGMLEQSLALLWTLAGAAWVLAGAWVLHRGVSAWSGHSRAVRLLAGLVALCLAWLAVAQARVIGINFLLSILVLVWVADIFAYFAGRAFGGRFSRGKLAPSISPGKSWEGVWGGMAGVVTLAFVWRWADVAWGARVPSLYSHIGVRGEWFLLIAVVFMAAMSVVGDLFESLVKRSAGVKDSSGLLPGHGGVLDRVDALLPTLPLAMMLYSV
ncbi:phosphatidate cytidylyltransferase [Rhodoferax sp. UBA5149]|uniref:phosphatidate cytidylyltransferase n=1 Tax=Rhodoferax sp. UBA5149 TaxID=1947379 RepID=UPI0025F3ABFF|nr:phosphatidate cytidylyltransferase [Rhodoferax sp. UBA5149]